MNGISQAEMMTVTRTTITINTNITFYSYCVCDIVTHCNSLLVCSVVYNDYFLLSKKLEVRVWAMPSSVHGMLLVVFRVPSGLGAGFQSLTCKTCAQLIELSLWECCQVLNFTLNLIFSHYK